MGWLIRENDMKEMIMIRNAGIVVLVLVAVGTWLAGPVIGQDGSEPSVESSPSRDLLPSEARMQMYNDANEAFAALPANEQITEEQAMAIYESITAQYEGRIIVDVDRLDDDEFNLLCEMAAFYMIPGLQDDVAEMLAAEAQGDGPRARMALKSQAAFRVAGEDVSDEALAEAQAILAEYRDRFPPSREDDLGGLYDVVRMVMWELNDRGDLDGALQAGQDEIDYLSAYDVPHPSWQIVMDMAQYLYDAGQVEEAEGLITQYIALLRSRSGQAQSGETAMRYSNIADIYEAFWRQLSMIGSQVEPVEFAHVLNSDGDLTFESLRESGKIVVIDVFAVWCGPCIRSFPELAALQERFAGDVTIIGMTDFQGMMTNHGAPRVENISQARELELMGDFIEHNNITWPVVFTPYAEQARAYGIESFPTVIVFDAEGIVRFYGHPMNGLAETLEDLVAEDTDAE
jgi:thiol-disulfide isomerase/thioredoxin